MLLKDAQVAIKVIVVKQKNIYSWECGIKNGTEMARNRNTTQMKRILQQANLFLGNTTYCSPVFLKYFPSQGFREACNLLSREK